MGPCGKWCRWKFSPLKVITVRKRSLRRLCFYTCLSVILFTGGVQAQARGCPGPGLGEARPGGGGQARGCIPACTEADTPPQQTATAADGTHPTGIHSSYNSDTKALFTLSVNGNAAMFLAISLWLNCFDFLINQVICSKSGLQHQLSLTLSVNGP